MTPTQAETAIRNSAGRFFTCVFIKADGSRREMVAPYVPPPQPTYVSPPPSQRIWWCRTSQRWYPDVGSCAVGWTR